jgi:hypothetical protein
MSEFNLTKFFRKQYLEEDVDLPKDKWVKLSKDEINSEKEQIFKLIDDAYAQIGGHPNYKSPDDVVGSEGNSNYEVINLDDDPEIDAVSVSKSKPAGEKYVATGHDGTSNAKSKMINHKATNLKMPGYYIEVSGKIKDILLAKGVPVVDDAEVIKRVLKGKNIELFDDGSYKRDIGGEKHQKVLLGNPL